ncbi:MAG: dephospho-CoA kinase [Eubacteriales bacterium]|nr:dephospho-CoA kinase [Eubacteriales bacterium]
MKLIGVTGGVGAGKSEILHYMENRYNCRVLLADDAARALEAPGGAIYEPLVRLVEEYPAWDFEKEKDGPPAVTLPDGRINNPEMARRIFSSPELREKVNALVHPAVKTYILEESAREREAERLDFFVVEAALLIEDGYKELVDALWYIYCDEKERRRRLRATRGYSDEKIDGILKSQLSEQKFREAADVVIDNSTTLDAAFAQVDAALTKDGIMRRIPLQKKDV